MKMKHCVASLWAVLSVSSVWADIQPNMPVPAAPAPAAPAMGATNGTIVDQGGNLHYQSQPPAGSQPLPAQQQIDQANAQYQPQQQPQQQPVPQANPAIPNTPGMSATQPTPSTH